MSKALCLAGMHRSGTSLTASWIEQCGLMISDGKVIQPNTGNLKGHFEDTEFVFLQRDMIQEIKPRSKGWIVLEGDSLRFNPSTLEKARKLVEKRNEKYNVWSWKDPRSTLFLQHWKEIIPELKVLLVWRPFQEVFRSLVSRSAKASQDQNVLKINVYAAAKIWLHYNRLVCSYKEMYPEDTLLLPLDYIIKENKLVFNLIQERLDISLHYYPIENLYEEKLMSSKKNPPVLATLVERYFQEKTDRMEESLYKLSDIA